MLNMLLSRLYSYFLPFYAAFNKILASLLVDRMHQSFKPDNSLALLLAAIIDHQTIKFWHSGVGNSVPVTKCNIVSLCDVNSKGSYMAVLHKIHLNCHVFVTLITYCLS